MSDFQANVDRLTIVIPALNEEGAIGQTIQRCLDARERIEEEGELAPRRAETTREAKDRVKPGTPGVAAYVAMAFYAKPQPGLTLQEVQAKYDEASAALDLAEAKTAEVKRTNPRSAEYAAAVKAELRKKASEVHVKADKHLAYGEVRKVLEKIHAAGAPTVALGTDDVKQEGGK